MIKDEKYDLVIPVFNEKNIISLLDYLFLNSKKILKIYICYDSHEDITIKKIKNSNYNNSEKIILVKNPFDGPCEAVKAGIAKSNASSIVIYPADDYNNAVILDKMHNLFLDGYDIICPSRFMSGGKMENCPLVKYMIVKIISFSLYHFSRIKIKDPTNGFRMFSRKLLDEISIKSKVGFAYSLELLVKGNKKNYKIIELPSVWIERDDRKSNFKILKWSKQYLIWFFYALL